MFTFTTTQTHIMIPEYADLCKQLAHCLKETAPTNIEDLTTAHFRKLLEACSNDIIARKGGVKATTVKKADNAEIAQITKDFIEPLKKILRIATEPVAIISYRTMKGDYCRYIAEYLTDHDKRKKKTYFDVALSAYFEAKGVATSSGLNPYDPLCLELEISTAKLYYLMGFFNSARLTNALAYRTSPKAEDWERLDEESRKLSQDIRERMRKLMNYWTDESINGYTGEMYV